MTGVALAAASQSGDGTAPCPSGSCVSTLGLVLLCHWVSHVCSELPGLCVSSQKHQPGFSVPGDVGTHLPTRLSAQLFPAWPLHPKTPAPLPMQAQGAMPPCARPRVRAVSDPPLGCPALQMLLRRSGSHPPPSRAFAFCVLLAAGRALPRPSRPSPPAPPGAAPTGASHTHK